VNIAKLGNQKPEGTGTPAAPEFGNHGVQKKKGYNRPRNRKDYRERSTEKATVTYFWRSPRKRGYSKTVALRDWTVLMRGLRELEGNRPPSTEASHRKITGPKWEDRAEKSTRGLSISIILLSRDRP